MQQLTSRAVEEGGGEGLGASNEVFSFDPDIAPRPHDKGDAMRPHRALSPSYLPVSTSAFSNVGCALHAPHSGALSQIVAKSWLE